MDTLDDVAASAAGDTHSSLETVGAINRAQAPHGKATISQNAFKGGFQQQLRELRRLPGKLDQGLESYELAGA